MTLPKVKRRDIKAMMKFWFRSIGKADRATEVGCGGVSRLLRRVTQVEKDLVGHRSGRQIFKLEGRACVQAQTHEVLFQGAADDLVDREVPVWQEISRVRLKM